MIIYIMQGIRENNIGKKLSICKFAGANILQHLTLPFQGRPWVGL